MEFVLTTALLLPGVASLALATGPRCRAVAPRDLPTALAATLAFALANFALAGLACRVTWGAEVVGSVAAGILATGEPADQVSRAKVLTSLLELRWEAALGVVYLGAASWTTGCLSARIYGRLLRILALKDSGITDPRTWAGRCLDGVLEWSGLTHLAIARGASYWLVVEQTARLLADKQPEVYADITQGDDSTLFAGQVVQVIASPSGETHSIVLKKARRYQRRRDGVRHENDKSSENDKKTPTKKGGWSPIGDSEAFYMRGDNVQNISYRVYGDPSRGGYSRVDGVGDEVWSLPENVLAALGLTRKEKWWFQRKKK